MTSSTTPASRTGQPFVAIVSPPEQLRAQRSGVLHHRSNIPPGLVIAGTNLIAVEIHRSGGTSSDISFDFELVGTGIGLNETPITLQGTPVSPGIFRIWFNASAGRSYVIEASSDVDPGQHEQRFQRPLRVPRYDDRSLALLPRAAGAVRGGE